MTIEHIAQIYIDRLALLDGFLRLAHLGRRSKEGAVARKVRRNLIVEINDMIEYERNELDDIHDYLATATEADRKSLEHYIPSLGDEAWDQFTTVFDKVVLLDAAPRIEGQRAFDPSMGRWYWVEEGYPPRRT